MQGSKSADEVRAAVPPHERAAQQRREHDQKPTAGSNEQPARPFSRLPNADKPGQNSGQ